MANKEEGQDNTTFFQNLSDFQNDTENFKQASDRAFSNISFGLGCCITVINVTTMYFLVRHKRNIDGAGFWQQLVFLCSNDIISGIAVLMPPLGYLFFDIHVDIYYSFCIAGLYIFPITCTLTAGNCCLVSIYRHVILRNLNKSNTKWHKYATPLMILGNVLISIVTVSSSVLVVSVKFGFQFKEFCDKVNMTGQNEYKSEYLKGTMIMLAMFLMSTNVFTIVSLVNMNRIKPVSSPSANAYNILKRYRYASKTFIMIVFTLNLTTVPTLLFLLVSIIWKPTLSVEITEIISRLITVNSLLNPFIYSLRSIDFRTAVWNDMKTMSSRIRCSHNAQ